MHENSYLELSIQKIEQKMPWGPSDRWTSSHFSLLSQEIFKATGKTVSDSTLKRLFGKKDTSEHYTPQHYTRNAIAEYLGYKDWHDFICQVEFSHSSRTRKHHRKKILPVILYVSLGLGLISVIIVLFSTMYIDKTKTFLKTTDTSNNVPYTVVFQYDVSSIRDSVFIDFGNNTPIPLPGNKHTITEFYKACGVFYPKILTRKKVLDSIRIENYSKHWQGGYSPNDDYRMYIPFEDTGIFRQDDRFYISPENLKFQDPLYSKGIYAEYRYMRKFNISMDSLDVSATVKNSPQEGGKLCYDVEIWLLGSSDNCKVRFVEPGCYRYGQFKVSEKEYTGRFDDLSAFAKDLKDWANIRVKILNSKALVYYNGSEVLTQEYKKTMGNLIGIYLRFYGTGSFREISIKNTRNIQIYSMHL